VRRHYRDLLRERGWTITSNDPVEDGAALITAIRGTKEVTIGVTPTEEGVEISVAMTDIPVDEPTPAPATPEEASPRNESDPARPSTPVPQATTALDREVTRPPTDRPQPSPGNGPGRPGPSPTPPTPSDPSTKSKHKPKPKPDKPKPKLDKPKPKPDEPKPKPDEDLKDGHAGDDHEDGRDEDRDDRKVADDQRYQSRDVWRRWWKGLDHDQRKAARNQWHRSRDLWRDWRDRAQRYADVSYKDRQRRPRD
jgi:hypothetical protein